MDSMEENCFNVSTWVNATTLGTLKQGSRATFTVVNLALALLMCGGNGLFIFVFLTQRRLQTTATFFLFHLAVADLLVGVALVYFVPFMWVGWMSQNPGLCLLRHSLFFLSLIASILCLLLVSVERLVAIQKPIKRRFIFSKPRLRLSAAVIWSVSFLIGFIAPMLFQRPCLHVLCEVLFDLRFEYNGYIFLPFFFAMGIALVTIQVAICVELHHKMAQSRMLASPARGEHQEMLSSKIFKTVGIIVIVFLACWIPFLVNTAMIVYADQTILVDPGQYYKPKYVWSNILGLLNSGMNVFIYAISMPKFRVAIKLLCCKRKKKSSSTDHQMGRPSISSLR